MDESLTPPEITSSEETVPDPVISSPKPGPKPIKPSTNSPRSFNLQKFMVPILIAFLFIAGYLVREITGVKSTLNEKVEQQDNRLIKLEQPVKHLNDQVEKDKFQAVFLAGGQVYFGKITHIDEATLTLENIYYLKTGGIEMDGTLKGEVSLSKLGKELHSPEDVMNIERKNILFWENLKDDGKVVQAIKVFEKTKK